MDLSRPLEPGMPVFPGDPEFGSSPVGTVARDGAAVAALHLSTHTGTHVDAPAHVLPDGPTLDDLPLDLFTGPAVVLDVRPTGAGGTGSRGNVATGDGGTGDEGTGDEGTGIGPEVLPDRIPVGTVVLFRTGGDAPAGTPDGTPAGTPAGNHRFLLPATARALRELGVRTVGIDTASVDAPGSLDVHRELLGTRADPGVVVENLANLDRIPATGCVVHLFPLRLSGGDGSPVRAVAQH